MSMEVAAPLSYLGLQFSESFYAARLEFSNCHGPLCIDSLKDEPAIGFRSNPVHVS